MKLSVVGGFLCFVLVFACSLAGEVATKGTAAYELALLQGAHGAFKGGGGTSSLWLGISDGENSAVIARRAMTLVGWLKNEGLVQDAQSFAGYVLDQIAPVSDVQGSDLEEKLYWQACLQYHGLGRVDLANQSLSKAFEISPDDDRLADLSVMINN